jgi:hypothetical protein
MVFKILRLQQRHFVNQISFKKFLTEVARDNHAGRSALPSGGVAPLAQRDANASEILGNLYLLQPDC